jgi:hypothetical protein
VSATRRGEITVSDLPAFRFLERQRRRGLPGVYEAVLSGHRESLPVQRIRRSSDASRRRGPICRYFSASGPEETSWGNRRALSVRHGQSVRPRGAGTRWRAALRPAPPLGAERRSAVRPHRGFRSSSRTRGFGLDREDARLRRGTAPRLSRLRAPPRLQRRVARPAGGAACTPQGAHARAQKVASARSISASAIFRASSGLTCPVSVAWTSARRRSRHDPAAATPPGPKTSTAGPCQTHWLRLEAARRWSRRGLRVGVGRWLRAFTDRVVAAAERWRRSEALGPARGAGHVRVGGRGQAGRVAIRVKRTGRRSPDTSSR